MTKAKAKTEQQLREAFDKDFRSLLDPKLTGYDRYGLVGKLRQTLGEMNAKGIAPELPDYLGGKP